MRKIFRWFFVITFFVACSSDNELQKEETSRLVVEGWIEDGGFPVVILTRTFPVSTEYRSIEDLSDYMLKWAKVTVSDGKESVILTGKYDEGYFPPFIYTTSRMTGKAGKQYSLTVEYKDYYATAKTSIPSIPDDCVFSVERCENPDTLFQIKATFKDNPSEKNYYLLLSRVGTGTKQYQASYLGAFDDTVLGEVTETPIYRGHQLMQKEYTPYYMLDDTVSVKLAHIDAQSFYIWDSYIKTLSLSDNMFLSTSENMKTNISGGYGYWCGYASITDYIVIKDSIANP